MTAADEMREIAREEVDRFAKTLAEEFLCVPTQNGTVSAPAFWQLLHRTMLRFGGRDEQVPV